jgi:endonuclease/exonuclease/phosphatase family metal-dependent hydrolase
MTQQPPRRKWRKRILWSLTLLMALVGLPGLLFVVNGALLASGEAARAGRYPGVEPSPSASGPGEVTVASYNIAKGWAPLGGLSFADRAAVEGKLRRMAAALRAERPDLVFLSEVMTECTPCPVDQAEFLARELGLPYWAFGENYNFGLPFCRVVGGNAVLSRFPLGAVANPSLAGRKPFYQTSNSRRALFAAADIGGGRVLLGSLHNDSFDLRNNEGQVRQVLEFIGGRPCVLAGDFNAQPGQRPIRLVRESGKFTGAFEGPPTFPSDRPDRRIDFVFAPAGWTHLGTRVLDADPSDHRPVVVRFRLPR